MAGPVYIADPEERGPHRRARRPVGAVPRALGHDPHRRRRPRREILDGAARGPGRRRASCCAGCARASISRARRRQRDPRPARRARGGRAGAPRMRHSLAIQIGPVAFRIGIAWRAPLDALARLYAAYPAPADGLCRLHRPARAGKALAPLAPARRSRSGAIISCPTPRRCRSPTACSPPRWA